MRRAWFAAFVISAKLEAQSLDVGGVEIRLGQDVTTAVQRLSIYRVVYSQQSNMWSITQPVAGGVDWLDTSRRGRVESPASARAQHDRTERLQLGVHAGFVS
jgi:hypothetical protein